MYIANYLCEKYGNDAQVKMHLLRYYICIENVAVSTQVTNLLNELEFVIVPFVNPDGYEVIYTAKT